MEYTEILNAQNEWVEGEPTEEGQRYRKVIDFGGDKKAYVESLFTMIQPEPETKITRLAFKQRLTADERKAIRNAANSNDDIFDFMDLLSEATYVDLSRQDTIDGVNAMVAAGLITSDRAYAVLNSPAQKDETFRG